MENIISKNLDYWKGKQWNKLDMYYYLHLFSFKTPILLGKKIRKNVKSIVGISPTMVLLFHLPYFYLKM